MTTDRAEPQQPSFKVGDIVRYGAGETALAKLHARHTGTKDGWHAEQHFGGITFVSLKGAGGYGFRMLHADENDLRIWNEEHALPRRREQADREAVNAFLEDVRSELMRARAKFPGDRIMTIALAEEFGELCKAVLDEPSANVRKEAVQCAVMAARVTIDGDSSVNEWRAAKGLDPLTASPPAAPVVEDHEYACLRAVYEAARAYLRYEAEPAKQREARVHLDNAIDDVKQGDGGYDYAATVTNGTKSFRRFIEEWFGPRSNDTYKLWDAMDDRFPAATDTPASAVAEPAERAALLYYLDQMANSATVSDAMVDVACEIAIANGQPPPRLVNRRTLVYMMLEAALAAQTSPAASGESK